MSDTVSNTGERQHFLALSHKDVVGLLVGAIMLFAIWIMAPALTNWIIQTIPWSTSSEAGQFGDQFGSINALFTGASFLGVALALILQTRELRDQVATSRDQAATLKEQLDLTRRASQFTAYTSVVDDYGTAEIKDAVRSLWGYYRENGGTAESLQAAYRTSLQNEQKALEAEPDGGQRSAILHQSIDHKRKIVTNFYHKVVTYINLGMLDRDLFYTGWEESDLRIIPDVLCPMEALLKQQIGETLAGDDFLPMSLYEPFRKMTAG